MDIKIGGRNAPSSLLNKEDQEMIDAQLFEIFKQPVKVVGINYPESKRKELENANRCKENRSTS